MLRPPHSRYHRLFVYHLDRRDIKPFDDADLIGVWLEDEAAILFFHRDRTELVNDICRINKTRVTYRADLDYRDWEAGVKIRSFTTSRLRISPVWDYSPRRRDDRSHILLDPSVIFGSGFHASTRLCLEALEQLASQTPSALKSVLDLGTGTGLLAIAAVTLGAGGVTALDNNPLSCAVARRNVELNRCGDKIRVREQDLDTEPPDSRCSLVIANLYKNLLLRLFERESFWQAAYYIISGFLPAMEAELLAALPPGVRMLARHSRDTWRLWILATAGGPEKKTDR